MMKLRSSGSRIERSALLPYPPRKVFELVNDVERYPEFLSGCIGAEVLERDDSSMVARLYLARHGLRFHFTTRNRLYPWQHIDLELVDGPFRHLAGRWSFEPLGEDACKVSLELEFELSSRLLSKATEHLLRSVAADLVDATVRRARQVYG